MLVETNTISSSTTIAARKILFGASSYGNTGVPETANNNRGCSPASHQSFFVGKSFTANEEFKRYQIEETTQRMLNRAAKK